MIIALESRFGTILSTGEPRRAIHLITHVPTVAISIAPEVAGYAVTRRALECAVLALEPAATDLVRVVTTVVFVVATPSC
jgi:hypothetical protein